MAYSGLYIPVQNAINSLNQQLNINADRESARQAQGLRNMMAQEDLIGRRHSRQMAEDSAGRDVRRLDMQETQQKFSNTLAQEAAGRDVRRLNMQEKQQKFANALAEESANRAERQLELSEGNQTFQQKLARAQEDRAAEIFAATAPEREAARLEAEEQLVPRDFNMYNLLPNTDATRQALFKDSNLGELAAAHMGGEGAQFDPESGSLILADGTVGLPNAKLKRKLPGTMGLIQSHMEPRAMRSTRIQELQTNVVGWQNEVKGLTKLGEKAPPGRKKLVQKKIADAQANIDALSKQPDTDLIPQYEQRQQMLDNFALQAAGSDTSPQVVQTILQASRSNNQFLTRLYEQRDKAMEATDKGANAGSTTAQWKAGETTALKPFGKMSAEGQFVISPELQDASNAVANLYQEQFEQGVPFHEAAMIARNTVLAYEDDYWDDLQKAADAGGYDLNDSEDLAVIRKWYASQEDTKPLYERFGYFPRVHAGQKVKEIRLKKLAEKKDSTK